MIEDDAVDEPASGLPDALDIVPNWDDEYLDRVSDRLMYSYDLERDRRVHGESFELYGELRILTQKQFAHPSLKYADHESAEHLFARRTERPTVAELERLVELGHTLAEEWVAADEEHYGTEFTFVLVAEELPDDVASFVEGFRDRTLLKWGYYGHYEVNLGVVVPEAERAVASTNADVVEAFTLWSDVTEPKEGLLSRFARRFWR